MADSLVSMVMQYLNPSIVDRIAGALGESRDSAQKGVAAGVPALLSGLVGMATQPGGADRLATAARQQDPGILNNLSNVIGGGGLQAVTNQGRTMVSSMLGNQASEGLIGTIGKYAGIGQGSATNLIGFLAPVVMAVLGRQQASQGLDAAGLGHYLADQKGAIAGAMPPGLADRLAAVRSSTAETLGQTAQAIPKPPQPAGRSWAYALGALVVLALLGYWFWGGRPQQVAQQTDEPAASANGPQTPGAPGGVMVGQVDVAKQLSNAVDTTTKSLDAVTDASTARDALPQINDAVAQLDKVKGMTDQLPADGKKTLISIVGNAKPALQQSINRVEAMPGVSDVLKPTLDSLQTKLNALASA